MATTYNKGQDDKKTGKLALKLPPHFNVIHNADNWDECVIVFPEDYREGFTYQDYRTAGYVEAGITPTSCIK
jgi:hypothetical protein